MKERRGILYWITGLAGAGKTTIGNRLYYEMKKQQDNVVFLDGDMLKSITSSIVGYSETERRARAMQYAQFCKVLTDQGMVVICCTIAMFDEVREWNRANNKGYVEIFINTPMDELIKRDQKGLYSAYQDGGVSNVVGRDIVVEYPKCPDIEIINDDSNDINASVDTILQFHVEMNSDFQRDKIYWNQYYKSVDCKLDPSQFACFVYRYLDRGKKLLECGCGNGRDSLYFANQGIDVTAIDVSDVAINSLNETIRKNGLDHALFVCDDFVSSSIIKTQQFDYVYSRFTLHAINAVQEKELLYNIKKALKTDGKLFIEARSINDELYGKGELIERNAYKFNNHFRRFIDKAELIELLKEIGYTIVYAEESKGFAINKNDDPPIIRVICQV